MAGIQTARSMRLMLEGQIRTQTARINIVVIAGIKLLTRLINEKSTLAKTECSMFAAVIVNEAFKNQPVTIHEDIYDEFMKLLKQYFDNLNYCVSIQDLTTTFVSIHIHWQVVEPLCIT